MVSVTFGVLIKLLRGFTIIVNHMWGFIIFENTWFSYMHVFIADVVLTLVIDMFRF